jgi:hypothetical protein
MQLRRVSGFDMIIILCVQRHLHGSLSILMVNKSLRQLKNKVLFIKWECLRIALVTLSLHVFFF